MTGKWTAIVLQLIKTSQEKVKKNIEKELYVLLLESNFVCLQVFSDYYSPLFLQTFPPVLFQRDSLLVYKRGGKRPTYWGFVSLPFFWFIPCFSGRSVPYQPISFALILIYCINDLHYQRIVHIHSHLNHCQIKWFLLGLYINSLYLRPECQWKTLIFRVYMCKEEKIFPFFFMLEIELF